VWSTHPPPDPSTPRMLPDFRIPDFGPAQEYRIPYSWPGAQADFRIRDFCIPDFRIPDFRLYYNDFPLFNTRCRKTFRIYR
jgi:hypothetical protein